ncbi:MAG: glycoside hydrolase family 55 protein [Acidobacteriia bacterium]|nr:glycoside hydrolase family 55 protein [Terriglobia bacterium]
MAAGVVTTVATDQSNALNAYTVTPLDISILGWTVTNESKAPGLSILAFRQAGVLKFSLSSTPLFSGPSPWFDVTASPFSAKCDGVTDDTVAIQAALTAACAVRSGATVFFPTNTSGSCVVTSLNADNCTGVKLVGGQDTYTGQPASRVMLKFTGATGPLLSLQSTTGVKVQGLFLFSSNAALSGNFIETAHSTTGGDTFADKFFDNTIIGTSSAPAVMLSLDKATDVIVENNLFTGAAVYIKGETSAASYSVNNTIRNNSFQAQPTTAFIQNPDQNWTITGNDFELGTGAPVLQSTGGSINWTSLNFSNNFVGDMSGTGTFTVFSLPATNDAGTAGGAVFLANQVGTTGTNVSTFSIGNNNNGVIIMGNNFGTAGSWATFLTLGTSVGITVGENTYAAINTFLSGTPATGSIFDNTGQTTMYGAVKAASSFQVGSGTAFSGRDGTGTNIASNTVGMPLVFGCNGTATSSQTLFLELPNSATTTCTDTAAASLVSAPLPTAGTVNNLICKAVTGGKVAGSGVMTVRKSGSPQALTCTFGTGTLCTDVTHSFSVAATDNIQIIFTTQATETLANIVCTVEKH